MSAKGIFLRRLAMSAVTALSLITAAHAADMSEEAIAERIAPVGSVYLDGEAPVVETAAAPSGPRTGETIYNTFCMACHTTGVAGAPKIGDAAAWEPRIAQGRDILNNHAINGFNGMPAKGTCMDCSDDEIIATIDYMLEQ
ncbi:c-type cytochrome [Enterovibrio coralii]|uniref:Cytochrome C n=1 Tax=Enterovibrio coralii TaxID=294935 RepID=A0A135IB82_9GAMM|nr:cytochrome c5 family protein [Enterovibrio coralii]KXF82658.1 cytochrome C [Enterovibrio coralii]